MIYSITHIITILLFHGNHLNTINNQKDNINSLFFWVRALKSFEHKFKIFTDFDLHICIKMQLLMKNNKKKKFEINFPSCTYKQMNFKKIFQFPIKPSASL